MHFFRRSSNPGLFPWILILTLVLRSFIAPGYMLSVAPEEGVRIIFCDGPVAVHTGQDEDHAHHHGDDSSNGPSIHISPVCVDWSTSSTLAIQTSFEPAVFGEGHVEKLHFYESPLIRHAVSHNRIIRAPPVLS